MPPRIILRHRALQPLRTTSPTHHQCLAYSTQPLPPTSSTDTPAPPLLLKFKQDLKTAMRSKDTNRLNVLRAVLAEITNLSKTSSPVQSDMQVVSLLRKKAAAAEAAAKEFAGAGRQDLVDKEQGQKKVLDEYAGSVETLGEEDVRKMVEGVVSEVKGDGSAKLDKGKILKRLIGPGGVFDGKNVEKTMVVRLANEIMGRA